MVVRHRHTKPSERWEASLDLGYCLVNWLLPKSAEANREVDHSFAIVISAAFFDIFRMNIL